VGLLEGHRLTQVNYNLVFVVDSWDGGSSGGQLTLVFPRSPLTLRHLGIFEFLRLIIAILVRIFVMFFIAWRPCSPDRLSLLDRRGLF
jgi:hypothetical protein